MATRLALVALRLCLLELLISNHGNLGLQIMLSLFQLRNNSYWLVKVSENRTGLNVHKLFGLLKSLRYLLGPVW